MTRRASLVANPDSKVIELAEAVYCVPLFWICLLSSEDVAAWDVRSFITTNRNEAIERCSRAISFLAGLFPEFTTIEAEAAHFLDLLRREKAKTIGVDVMDHVAVTENFPRALSIAVGAIESNDERASFTTPATTTTNPFTGKPIEIAAETYKSTRELICFVSSIPKPSNSSAEQRLELAGLELKQRLTRRSSGGGP